MKKYRVTLTDEERQGLHDLISAGKAAARKLAHARILLKADAAEGGPAWPDWRIAEALEVSTATIERVRQRFVEQGLEAALADLEPDRVLVFCDEGAPVANPYEALRNLGNNKARLAVIVGPEGGFTDEERARVGAHESVVRVSLGPRILRADTAAVAALAIVQSALGDWR